MEITKIEPGEKYVVVISEEATAAQVKRIADSLKSFREDDMHTIFFIYGVDAAVVPASQIVGYIQLCPEKACCEGG